MPDAPGEVNVDGDPVWQCEGDCDDYDGNNYPGNSEQCDGQDNDCNLIADAPGGEVDADMDGVLSCADCDDSDPDNYPGNAEVCDGQDNNCNFFVDQAEVPVVVMCGSPPNATPGCQGAAGCVIVSCQPGYYDKNGIYSDGCESNTP